MKNTLYLKIYIIESLDMMCPHAGLKMFPKRAVKKRQKTEKEEKKSPKEKTNLQSLIGFLPSEH